MSYLLAKKYNQRGCLAIEIDRGKELAKLVTDLGKKTSGKGIQILTVSSVDAYGEYKPYRIADSLDDFIAKVMNMLD